MTLPFSPDEPSELADGQQLGDLLETYRTRLKSMVRIRLHQKLRGRIDPSDVIQETFLEVTTRLPQFLENPEVPFYVWVRYLAGQKLSDLHRRHLGRQNRDARREVRWTRWGGPEASSIAMAEALLDQGPSPSQVVMRRERCSRLWEALEQLKPMDREVVAMRHFEGLRNQEVAEILELSKPAASLRYVRAMQRLGALLETDSSAKGAS